MKKIVIFKDKGKEDIFDSEDKVINVMTPATFSAKKLGLSDKAAFLYKGFPMYLDRTVIHARREDKKMVDELLSEATEQLDEISVKKLQSYRDAGQHTQASIDKRHKHLTLALNKIRKANLKKNFTKHYDKKDEPKVAASNPKKAPPKNIGKKVLYDHVEIPTLFSRLNKLRESFRGK